MDFSTNMGKILLGFRGNYFTYFVNFSLFSMFVVETVSQTKIKAIVRRVTDADLGKLTKRRYFFDWKLIYGKADLYKLCLDGDEDIKGLMAIIDFPEEYRVEVKLIAASKENVATSHQLGKTVKRYENVAMCLLVFAGRIALANYGIMACLSLIPKTNLRQHYIRKYGMKVAGQSLYLDSDGLEQLITKLLQ
jgi:hypothetical protein